jgi:chromosomal replication initiation ATPase DnaA
VSPDRIRQLPLDLAHPPAVGREDFFAAPSNQAALAWIERWPDWPGRSLALYGPPGSGKTHLAGIWRARAGAVALTLGDLSWSEAPLLVGSAPACALDTGPWAGATSPAETALLHLVNWLAQHARPLLLTSRVAPARWPIVLADLRSRLAAMPAVEIAAPDDALLAALLAKLLADRHLPAPGEVVEYLVARMERSCEAAGRIVAELDRASLAAQRGITVPLAQSVLAAPERWRTKNDSDVTE